MAALLIGLHFHFDWRVPALALPALPWVWLWVLLAAPEGFAWLGWGFALLWVCGLAVGLALACFGALALGVGCGSGSCPLGVKGRKGRAWLFFAFIVVWIGGLRFFLVRLVGWSWLALSPFSRALRGWGAQGFHRGLGKALGILGVVLLFVVVCKKRAVPCSLRPRLSFLRFALPSSWSGLGVCGSSWLVWLVGRGLPPALFPVPCGAGGQGAFIVVSARLLGSSLYS